MFPVVPDTAFRLGDVASDVIPPLRRRCPHCGHTGWTSRFAVTRESDRRLVVCPACGHRFEPVDQPWLN